MNILVLGGHGTIGKSLVKTLGENHKVYAPESYAYDLVTEKETDGCFYDYKRNFGKPDCVLNLACEKTNIKRNNTHPATIYRNTVRMFLNIFDSCVDYQIPRFIQFICSCSYPPKKLLKENNLDQGAPHESIKSHAHAKRQLYYMSQFYKKEHNLNTNTICVNNVYGGFNWQDEILKLHADEPSYLKVLDSLFFRMLNCKRGNLPEMEIWGTGKIRREFIFFEDVARATIEIINQPTYTKPLINIGTQEDISIAQLAKLLKKVLGYRGKLVFNSDYPDGQKKKLLDSSLFRSDFCDFKFTPLEEGIKKMVEAYVV